MRDNLLLISPSLHLS